QPAPSLTGASRPTPTTIQVNGFLKAAANTTYRVEIFASPSNTSQGQGQNFLGSVLVMTNPRGRGSFVFNSTFAPSAGTSITATATDPANNTSAFSAPISLGGNANELFVASVYGLLLDRAPDAGSTFWVSALNSGASPMGVVLGIQG